VHLDVLLLYRSQPKMVFFNTTNLLGKQPVQCRPSSAVVLCSSLFGGAAGLLFVSCAREGWVTLLQNSCVSLLCFRVKFLASVLICLPLCAAVVTEHVRWLI
jgi:hypothetical protein